MSQPVTIMPAAGSHDDAATVGAASARVSYTALDRWIATLRFRECRRHVPPGGRICDLGCGVEPLLLSRLAGCGLRVGIDYQSFASPVPGVLRVRADLTTDLPLRDSSFDGVTLLAVIEHLEDPRRVLSEAHRILAPGGTLVMTWPSGIVDPLLEVLARLGLVSHAMESRHHQPRRPVAHWVDVLGSIGFRGVRHRTFEFGLNHIMVARRPGATGSD